MADDLQVTIKVIVYIYKFELTRLSFSREIWLEQEQVVDVELIADCT